MIILLNRSTSEHNKMVQAAIISEIVNQPNSKVKTETAKGSTLLVYNSSHYDTSIHSCSKAVL